MQRQTLYWGPEQLLQLARRILQGSASHALERQQLLIQSVIVAMSKVRLVRLSCPSCPSCPLCSSCPSFFPSSRLVRLVRLVRLPPSSPVFPRLVRLPYSVFRIPSCPSSVFCLSGSQLSGAFPAYSPDLCDLFHYGANLATAFRLVIV